jgi:chorismate mutase
MSSEVSIRSHTRPQISLTLLDGPLQPVFLPALPSSVHTRGARVLEPALHNLHPVTRTIVVSDLSRSLGDVHEARAGVLNELVVENLEPELVACLDRVCGGLLVQRALVAAQVVGVHQLAGQRRIVRVVVLANVCVLAANAGAVDNQTIEDVMRVGTKGSKKRENSNSLHIAEKRIEDEEANV